MAGSIFTSAAGLISTFIPSRLHTFSKITCYTPLNLPGEGDSHRKTPSGLLGGSVPLSDASEVPSPGRLDSWTASSRGRFLNQEAGYGLSCNVARCGLFGQTSPRRRPRLHMKILCAWCRAVIRDQDGTMYLTSHGICQKCAAHEIAKIKLTKAGQGGDKARPGVNPKK
jgi:hypothetical protein